MTKAFNTSSGGGNGKRVMARRAKISSSLSKAGAAPVEKKSATSPKPPISKPPVSKIKSNNGVRRGPVPKPTAPVKRGPIDKALVPGQKKKK